jgi:hypothetical protein
MNVVLTVVALVFVLVGVYFNQKNLNTKIDDSLKENGVLSENVIEEKKETTPSPNSPKQEVQEEFLVEEIIPTVIPTNSPIPTQQKTNLQSFVYPSARVTQDTSKKLVLESTDSADTVTDWYKNRINAEGMNVTSFVTTNTNDNVLNKLVGASNTKKVSVEITKDAGEVTVKIFVEQSS